MISEGRFISACGASGKISQRAHIHHNSNTSCLESIAGKSGSPQHYVMGSLLSWERCGNWNCVFVWREAAACVDRMFLTSGSWMGLAINTQSGSSLSATIRVWSSARAKAVWSFHPSARSSTFLNSGQENVCRLGSSTVGRLWAKTGGVLRQRALYRLTAPWDSLFGVDRAIEVSIEGYYAAITGT